MRIEEPRVEVLCYTQLPPSKTDDFGGGYLQKLVPQDPCSEMSRVVERCGRVSYKSEDKIAMGSADGFCTRVCNVRRDESIMEHASITLLLVTDRMTTHQLVRHRIGAYTQESTHYLNYSKDKFGREIVVMRPLGIEVGSQAYFKWELACLQAEKHYMDILDLGVKHYHARSVLPSFLKTEIAVTYNLRMWRHVISQRSTPNNTPEIAHIMKLAAVECAKLCPEVLGDWEQRAANYLK